MTYQQYVETEETKRIEFARKAAAYFGDHPEAVTYTANGLQPGELVAFRWGLAGDCVLCVKVDEYEPIINYCNFVPREKATQYQVFTDAGLKAISTKKARGES